MPFGPAIATGTVLNDYSKKKNSGALDAPESSNTSVDLGKYSQVQNPWRAQLENNSYQQSWWDRVGNWIGFNTKEDSYRLELERLAKEWDSKMQLQNVTDEYNSEDAQASRQREAGLNPDLNGVDAGAASSSVPSAPDSSGLAPIEQKTTFDEVQPVLSTVANAVTTAFGSVSGMIGLFQDINSRKLANDNSLLNNISRAYDFGFNTAEKNQRFEDVLSSIQKTNLDDYELVDGSYVHKKTGELLIPDSVVTANYDDFIDRFQLRNNRNTKRYFRSFRNGFMDFINGQVGQLKSRKTGNDLTSARESGAKQSIVGLTGDLNSLFQPLAPTMQKAYRWGIEADSFSLKVDSEYYKTVSGVQKAIAQNSSNTYNSNLLQNIDAVKQAEVVNTNNQIQSETNRLYLSNQMPEIRARIEKLQAECEELSLKWQKSFELTNSELVSIFGDDNGFGRYILQSLIGNIQGNLFQSIHDWQDRNMNKLLNITNMLSNLTPIK